MFVHPSTVGTVCGFNGHSSLTVRFAVALREREGVLADHLSGQANLHKQLTLVVCDQSLECTKCVSDTDIKVAVV